MAEIVANWAQSTFTTPVNGGALDASVVLGNDNNLRVKFNNHDADSGIHFQSSTLASRPAAGTAGRKWYTTDGKRVYYDNGVSWDEIAYLLLAGGTVTGATSFSAGITVTGSITMATAASKIVPGATSLALRNNADSADNILISNAGAVTIRAGLTVTDGDFALSSGQASLTRNNAGDTGTALTIDWVNGNLQRCRLTGNCTFTFSNPVVGASYFLEVLQDGTGGRTVTWPATVKWDNSTTPTSTTTANRKDCFVFVWNGTNYIGGIFAQNVSDTV